MTTYEEREQVIVLLNESVVAGARRAKACEVLGLSERTLQRWQTGATVRCDQRPLRDYQPPHKLTAIERAEVLAVANSDEFGHLPPSQIVPRLADQGRYLASESTFYRILREENQLAHRRSERPAQTRTKPRAICATAPNQLYSWDITYLPSVIRGQFFYLYLFVDIFSRKIGGESLFLSKDFPCSQRGNPQKYRDKLNCYASPSRPGHSFATQQGDGSHALQ
jgi:transposase InsO family protein